MNEGLKRQAAAILASNDLGGWTRPAPGLYPHQWLWDSCFVAMGLSHTNPARAAHELHRLVRSQWRNGMMPHMVYNDHFPYRLEALLWGTGRLSPKGIRTSGITQPPMLAIAVEKVSHALPAAESRKFVRGMMRTLTRYHQWIYRDRDPHDTGLAACLHSWESGLDDTPYWTEPMSQLPPPPLRWRWLREYRPVLSHERARPQDLQNMLSLAHILKRNHYDSAEIMAHSPVVIQDLVFNSILAAANESLERLAEYAGTELPDGLQRRFLGTRRALAQLWDPDTEQYYSRDALSGHLIRVPTIATFMPLFAGTATHAHAERLRRLITHGHGYQTPFTLPSVPSNSPHFEAQRYWRGPVWINMNWFVITGLQRYGFTTEANQLRDHTLALIQRSGFREYYNPLTGDGLGAHQFSWSAALTLELLSHTPAHELVASS
jgi:hypothetical protein